MISERIHQDAVSYFQRCEKNAANRKSQQSTTVDDGERPSTAVDDGRPINKTNQKQTVSKEAEEESPAATAAVISLIQKYSLPDSEANRQAVAQDLMTYGSEKLEAALKRASDSNSKSMLSVNFYRSILTRKTEEERGYDDDGWRNCPTF